MHWFIYRSCRYFFYYVKAADRAAADALFSKRFFPLETPCAHCGTLLIEEVEEADEQTQAELDDLAMMRPESPNVLSWDTQASKSRIA